MRNIWTIVKKELARVFTDRRVIFSTFILPPLTIYLIYGLMGLSAESETKKVEAYHPTVYVINSPSTLNISEGKTVEGFNEYLFSVLRAEIERDEKGDIVFDQSGNPQYVYDTPVYNKDNIDIKEANESELSDLKEDLKAGELDLIIEFTSDFENLVENYQTQTLVPEVKVYYNMNSSFSKAVNDNFKYILSSYNSIILNQRFTQKELSVFVPIEVAQGNINKAKGSFLAMLLPMLLVIYLMTGAMANGMESIAGEKERGTIATLLVTPIKRTQLAIGKIISISIIAVLSSIASFLGLIAVMPTFSKLGGGAIANAKYYPMDYLMLFSVMFVSVLLFVALIVIVSTYAKTVKEAGTLVMPIYLIVMGGAMFNMFVQNITKSFTVYLIPIYNVVLALKAIFMFDLTMVNWLVTLGSTIIYTSILIFLIQKMFRSEKIMFNK